MAKKKKKKWYVVWKGRNPGIYETWDECNDQVYKVRGAQYKSYTSKLQAENAFKNANYVVWRGKEPGVYQGLGVALSFRPEGGIFGRVGRKIPHPLRCYSGQALRGFGIRGSPGIRNTRLGGMSKTS